LWVYGELRWSDKSAAYETSTYSPFEALGILPSLFRVIEAGRERPAAPNVEDDPVIKAVAAFVQDYGLLGQTALGGKRPIVQIQRTSGRPYPAEADDLVWFRGHASTVHLVMSLIRALRGKINAEALERLFVGLPQRIATVQDPWWMTLDSDFKAGVRTEGVVKTAQRALSALLTPNLQGVDLVIDPESGAPVFRFRALIQAVYWMLADRWGIGRRPIRCKECGAVFFPDDDREKFCPPPPGVNESRCGRRRRMRILRKAQKRRRREKR
jgi:hypothetical protein